MIHNSIERAKRDKRDSGRTPIIERTIDRFGMSVTRKYDLGNQADMVRYVARQRFAWPGGYELIMIISGQPICQACIRDRYRIELRYAICGTFNEYAIFSGADFDPETCYCDNCGKDVRIR